jgi:hypothetical protein
MVLCTASVAADVYYIVVRYAVAKVLLLLCNRVLFSCSLLLSSEQQELKHDVGCHSV